MKTNNQKIVLVTKETAASLLAWIIKNPTMAALIAAIGWGVYVNEVVIPGKDREIERWRNTPPTVVTNTRIDTVRDTKTIWRTKTDSVVITDTVFVNPGQITWTAQFSDTLIKGNVKGFADIDTLTKKPRVWDVGLNYSLVQPITRETITNNITYRDTVKVPTGKNFRVQTGMFLGGGPAAFGLGPEIGVLTKRDDNYTYRYNLVDRTHWISYKRTIRLRGK